MKKIVLSMLMFAGMVYASMVDVTGEVNGYEVNLKSQRALVVGNNTFFVEIKKDGKIINDAQVKAKFLMPEMPGMPYTEFMADGELKGNRYEMIINFSMSCTWQYQLRFKTSDGQIHALRGSVTL